MTPAEHIDSLADFLQRCADRQRTLFKMGGTAYQQGQADALSFAAVHLRETWKEIEAKINATS